MKSTRYVLTILFTAFVCTAYSQDDALFVIVTLSYGVNIDGRAVAVGEEITPASKQISIPVGGYLGIVTADGYPYELTKSIAVADVNSFVKNNQLIPTGATTRRALLKTPLVFGNFPFVGDTLFLTWEEDEEKDRLPGIKYNVRFIDRRENTVAEEHIDRNWILLDIQSMIDNGAVYMFIQSQKTEDIVGLAIKRTKASEKLLRDIERLGSNANPALLCAVYAVNKLEHDRNLVLYKIFKRGIQTPGLPGRYIARLNSLMDLK